MIAEIERRGTLSPADYFRQNWKIVPAELAARAAAEQAPGGGADGESHGERGAAPAQARLRVLATNDFHGALLATRPGFARGREVGGAAALAGVLPRASGRRRAPRC